MRTPHLARPRVPRPHLPGPGTAKAIGAGALALAVAGSVVVATQSSDAPEPEKDTSVVASADMTGLFTGPDNMGFGSDGSPSIDVEPVPDAVVTTDSAAGATRVDNPITLAPLAKRTAPDIVVTTKTSFSPTAVTKISELAKGGTALPFRSGTVSLKGHLVPTAGVNPAQFRQFAAKGTAEATAVWQAVAKGEAVASHNAAKQLGLVLGDTLQVTRPGGGTPVAVRLGALATTGLPSTELVIDDALSDELGIPSESGLILATGKGGDPVSLANMVRKITGDSAVVDLLAAPAANPTAFLTGGAAAKAFGAFSYRYFADGTIAPDASWVQNNIQSTVVPILGRVTCHKLMIVQLRGALAEIEAAGLGDKLHTYDGCYVPRFIESNPDRPISLHTWGIAIDIDASTNYRGIRGTMDMQVVNIFKKWGFRWGGDWNYTDPMHFEMGAVLTNPN